MNTQDYQPKNITLDNMITQSEGIKITGRVRLQVFNKFGALLSDTGFLENTITNSGKAAMAGLVGNTGGISAFNYLALGSDNTAASASQTALIAEYSTLGLSRSVATASRITTSQTNDTLSLTYTWTATGSTTIQEIGILNASSVGIMLGRKVTGGVAVINTNSVVATYTVQFS